ncbi:MAG: hypothetical protein Q4G48_00405 [Bacteroidia bacterium]|nr:hypothetical protein [Bacteroidia bacterium]
MVVISPTELRNEQKKYLDLAEKEQVVIKRGKKFIQLNVSDKIHENELEEWVKDFLAIPEEYRCNPFDISPSGDVFFADKRNLAAIEKGRKDIEEGRVREINSIEEFRQMLGL